MIQLPAAHCYRHESMCRKAFRVSLRLCIIRNTVYLEINKLNRKSRTHTPNARMSYAYVYARDFDTIAGQLLCLTCVAP